MTPPAPFVKGAFRAFRPTSRRVSLLHKRDLLPVPDERARAAHEPLFLHHRAQQLLRDLRPARPRAAVLPDGEPAALAPARAAEGPAVFRDRALPAEGAGNLYPKFLVKKVS